MVPTYSITSNGSMYTTHTHNMRNNVQRELEIVKYIISGVSTNKYTVGICVSKFRAGLFPLYHRLQREAVRTKLSITF